MTPALSAAICTFRRYELLDGAIASLAAQSVPVEVLVVDNSPGAPGSADARARHASVARWLEEPTPGLSRARNAALAAASAPVLAYLDDDARAAPGWAEGFLAGFAQLGESVACVGGRVRLRYTAPPPAWLDWRFESYLSALDLGEETRLLAPGEWVAGASLAYRVAELRGIGGFNAALGRSGAASLLSNDETEVSARLSARGLLTGYTPLAEAEHLVEPSRLSQAWFRRRAAWQAVSDLIAGDAKRDPAESWQAVKDFLLTANPAERTLRALVTEAPDADAFHAQLGAVHDVVAALLAEARDRDA
jgi:glycosyltransferase involved in cell wall biosynthesis